MKEIYDNGEQLLGVVKYIRSYNNNLHVKGIIDDDTYNELEEDLKDMDEDAIIMIDYSFGMGNICKVWETSDIIKEA